MRRFLRFVVLSSLLALPLMAQAQDNSRIEVFGGYQYLRAGNVDGMDNGANASGWDTSATFNFNQHFGVTADFSGSYKSTNVPNPFGNSFTYPVHFHAYTYAFGPVVSLNSRGTYNPFVHALFGQAHLYPNGCVIFSGSPDECGSGTYSGFAMMLGGGLDAKAGKSVWLRLFQFDWMRLPSDGGGQNNNLRVSTGVVFHF
jgi:hypothetical protein